MPKDAERQREMDTQITTRIRRHFDQAGKGALDAVHVEVVDSVVTLQGVVEGAENRILAEGLAVGSPGVRGMHNQLVVLDRPADGDRQIAERIAAGISDSPLRRCDLPRVEVRGAQVVLTGIPTNYAMIGELEQLVRQIPGVEDVENRLAE